MPLIIDFYTKDASETTGNRASSVNKASVEGPAPDPRPKISENNSSFKS